MHATSFIKHLTVSGKSHLSGLSVLLITGLLALNDPTASAQSNNEFYTVEISGFFDSVRVAETREQREAFSDSITYITGQYIRDESGFLSKLEGIRYLGQFFSPDSTLKILNWNIVLESGLNRYSSWIARRSGDRIDCWYIESNNGLEGISSQDVLDKENWYGALYYDIRSFERDGKNYYTLLGLDLNGLFTNSKVIEILYIDPIKGPLFGAPMILYGKSPVNRIVFRYSSMVSMMLRYEQITGRIIFDHLSPSEPQFAGVYQYYGPDFSYDAIEFRDGFWRLVEDIDLRNQFLH